MVLVLPACSNPHALFSFLLFAPIIVTAALDEFDIFMDEEARKISLELVQALGKRLHWRQFIFITPQNLRHVIPSETVVIHKLRKPERAFEGMQQTTID